MRTSTSRRRLGRAYALGLGWIVVLAVSLALLTPALMDIYFVLGVESVPLQIATTMAISLTLATTATGLTAWFTRARPAAAPQATPAASARATASANA